MNEIWKIVLTSAGTLFGGIILLIVSQAVTKLVVEPGVKVREIVGEIRFNLVLHARIIANPDYFAGTPEMAEASKSFRALAGRLQSASCAVVCYNWIPVRYFLPAKGKIDEAVQCLIYLSNLSSPVPQSQTTEVVAKLQAILDKQ